MGSKESKSSSSLRQDESVYLGMYWGDREEEVSSSALRVGQSIDLMASTSGFPSSWSFRVESPGSRYRSVQIDTGSTIASLVSILEAGMGHDDVHGHTRPKLGYSCAAVGDDVMRLRLSILCGATAARAGVFNAVVLKLRPLRSCEDGELYENVPQVMQGLINVWDPTWGVVTSHALREAVGGLGDGRPFAGWMTYIRSEEILSDIANRCGHGWLASTSSTWPGVTIEGVKRMQVKLEAKGVTMLDESSG